MRAGQNVGSTVEISGWYPERQLAASAVPGRAEPAGEVAGPAAGQRSVGRHRPLGCQLVAVVDVLDGRRPQAQPAGARPHRRHAQRPRHLDARVVGAAEAGVEAGAVEGQHLLGRAEGGEVGRGRSVAVVGERAGGPRLEQGVLDRCHRQPLVRRPRREGDAVAVHLRRGGRLLDGVVRVAELLERLLAQLGARRGRIGESSEQVRRQVVGAAAPAVRAEVAGVDPLHVDDAAEDRQDVVAEADVGRGQPGAVEACPSPGATSRTP